MLTRISTILVLCVALLGLNASDLVTPMANPAMAQQAGQVPGDALGSTSDSEFWRQVRRGNAGSISIKDQQAAVMIQSEGESWRSIRNGPVSNIGGWFMLAVILALTFFYVIRGRVRIDGGPAGRTMLRFEFVERFAHWLTAGSFLVLALTGLNVMFGKYTLLRMLVYVSPDSGQQVFAFISLWGKYIHHGTAFAFMGGLVMIFVLWVKDNFWDRYDFGWIIVLGGLLRDDVHPPAAKFNFGQKTVFWMVILFGIALSVTGLLLMFPFVYLDMQEQQLIQLVHGALAVINIGAIFGHIYIGSVGMEGAVQAMTTGQVDANWLRQHHSVWAVEQESQPAEATPHAAETAQPAE